MLISLDTETTGLSLYHGCKPFLVTICKDDGNPAMFWEWDVDPLTREVHVDESDLEEIKEEINKADKIILHNTKFDVTALETIGITDWPWDKVEDTLMAGHMLNSSQPHNLTDMCLIYLHTDIEEYETKMGAVCKEVRRYVRSKLKKWAICDGKGRGGPDDTGKESWKADTWLPRVLGNYLGDTRLKELGKEHWLTVTAEYAVADSTNTLYLWKVLSKEIERRNLWEIYRERLKLLPICKEIERRGISGRLSALISFETKCKQESNRLRKECIAIAKENYNCDLTLPKSGINRSLIDFVFNEVKLPAVMLSAKTGDPSLNAEVLDKYKSELDSETPAGRFVNTLSEIRKRDTSTTYIAGYRRYLKPVVGEEDGYRLHPSLNPTGTSTLRMSSRNPNGQNIGKKEGFNLREVFGPLPGREWWRMDGENLELRIPAYESQDPMMLKLFDNPNDPPYFGKYHMLMFDLLHPEMFAEHGIKVKDVYADTWYQWTKNGDFALSYGSVEESGTADRAYHVKGAHRKLKEKLAGLTDLNNKQVYLANKHGYVETIPDKDIDPDRGYPIQCKRTNYGRVLETVPLNYHVQSTAMWWMSRCMVKCSEQLDKWRRRGFDGYITIQVHDELIFDFPRSVVHPKDSILRSNLWRAKKLREIMESCGPPLGVKTPVSCSYHLDTWAKGESF